MAVEKDKLKELLKQLPEDLQAQVITFAESLLKNEAARPTGKSGNGRESVRSFFGSWDSGNPQSANNDSIDSDLAREYSNSHKADS
jgi:hypothetical protein